MGKSKRQDRIEEASKHFRSAMLRNDLSALSKAIKAISDESVSESGDNVKKLGEQENPVAYANEDLRDVTRKLNALINRLKNHGIIE